MDKLILTILITFTVLGLSGCVTSNTGTLSISVRECGDGPQLEGVTTTISNEDGIVAQMETDSFGLLSIDLVPGTYEIVIANEGYEFYSETKVHETNGTVLLWCLTPSD